MAQIHVPVWHPDSTFTFQRGDVVRDNATGIIGLVRDVDRAVDLDIRRRLKTYEIVCARVTGQIEGASFLIRVEASRLVYAEVTRLSNGSLRWEDRNKVIGYTVKDASSDFVGIVVKKEAEKENMHIMYQVESADIPGNMMRIPFLEIRVMSGEGVVPIPPLLDTPVLKPKVRKLKF